MPNPILQAINKLNSDQEHRHAWLFRAADQIRKDNINLRSVSRDSNRLTVDQ